MADKSGTPLEILVKHWAPRGGPGQALINVPFLLVLGGICIRTHNWLFAVYFLLNAFSGILLIPKVRSFVGKRFENVRYPWESKASFRLRMDWFNLEVAALSGNPVQVSGDSATTDQLCSQALQVGSELSSLHSATFRTSCRSFEFVRTAYKLRILNASTKAQPDLDQALQILAEQLAVWIATQPGVGFQKQLDTKTTWPAINNTLKMVKQALRSELRSPPNQKRDLPAASKSL